MAEIFSSFEAGAEWPCQLVVSSMANQLSIEIDNGGVWTEFTATADQVERLIIALKEWL